MAVVTPTAVREYRPSVERWRSLVCAYDWSCDWALGIVQRESNGDPDAYNYTPIYNAGVENHVVCLFQLASPLHDGYFHGGDWHDPAVCVQAAYELWESSGEAPWRLW